MLKLLLRGDRVPQLEEVVDGMVVLASKVAAAWAVYIFVIEITLPCILRVAVCLGVLDEQKLRFPLDFWFAPRPPEASPPRPQRGRKSRRSNLSSRSASLTKVNAADQLAGWGHGRDIRAAITAVSAMQVAKEDDPGRPPVSRECPDADPPPAPKIELGSIGPPPASDSELRNWFMRNNPLATVEDELLQASSTQLTQRKRAKLHGYLRRARQDLPLRDHDELSQYFQSFISREIGFTDFIKKSVQFLIVRENWNLLGLLQLIPETEAELRTAYRIIEEYRQSPQGLLDCGTMPMFQDVKALIFILASPRHTYFTKARALRQLHDLMNGQVGGADATEDLQTLFAKDFIENKGPQLMVLLAERHPAFRDIVLRILLAQADIEGCPSGMK